MTPEPTIESAEFRCDELTPMPTAYGYANLFVAVPGRVNGHKAKTWVRGKLFDAGLHRAKVHVCEPQYYRSSGLDSVTWRVKVNFKDHQSFVMAKIVVGV